MSDCANKIASATACKFSIFSSAAAAASGAAERSGFVVFLGKYGTEIASFGVIAGVFFGFLSFWVQVYFNYRRDKRESTESVWRMGVDPDRRKSPPGDPPAC